MSLTIRKAIVLGLIGSILLLGNIVLVASWLSEKGVVDWLGNSDRVPNRDRNHDHRCPVNTAGEPDGEERSVGSPVSGLRSCVMSRGGYCSECGSKV